MNSLIDVPVCNSFQAKIFNDQLCYEVDLNRFRDKDNLDTEYKSGFAFILDYNEDRQVTFIEDSNRKDEGFGLVSTIAVSDHNKHAYIYLDTIGIKLLLRFISYLLYKSFSSY